MGFVGLIGLSGLSELFCVFVCSSADEDADGEGSECFIESLVELAGDLEKFDGI